MRDADRFPAVALSGGALLALLLAFTFHLPQRLLALGAPAPAHRIDGQVSPGEYRFRWADDASKLVFQWSIVGDRLIGAVTSPDTGWVAVGFGGEGPLMYGADIVIGYVDARGAHVEDDFANTPTSHVSDVSLGGHDDVLTSAGRKSKAGTTIEFERPLTAYDSTDRPIVRGPMRVLMASSETPDLMAYHVEGHKAVALLDLYAGPAAAAAGAGSTLPDHLTDVQIMLATWMAILLVIGVHGLLGRAAEGAGTAAGPSEPERRIGRAPRGAGPARGRRARRLRGGHRGGLARVAAGFGAGGGSSGAGRTARPVQPDVRALPVRALGAGRRGAVVGGRRGTAYGPLAGRTEEQAWIADASPTGR